MITTYEIVEDFPRVLKTGVPLFDIFTYGTYFLTLPFYILIKIMKKEMRYKWRPKREVNIDDDFFVKMNTDKIKVDRTPPRFSKVEIDFYYKKDAIQIVRELKEMGYNISMPNSFYVKKRVEYTGGEPEIRVRFAYPDYAYDVAKFFRIGDLK